MQRVLKKFPQVGGGIDPLGLVDPWITYQVFKKNKNQRPCMSM